MSTKGRLDRGYPPGPVGYQRREAVLERLHGQRHLPSDYVPVEVQVQVQVQVFGDAPGERGEGARVRHDDPSGCSGETETTIALDR